MRKLGEPMGLRGAILERLRTGVERRTAILFARHFATRYTKGEFDRTLRRMAADGLVRLEIRREFDGVYNPAFPRGGTAAVRSRRYVLLTDAGAAGGGG